jgi:glycosidase
MFEIVQTLTNLKHEEPALIRGSFQALSTGQTQVLAFRRSLNNDTFNIYLNFGSTPATVNATGTIVYASDQATLQSQPAFSVLITRTAS